MGGELQQIDRRDLLKLGLLGALGSVVPLLPAKSALAASDSTWRVSFHQQHTGENFDGVYRVGDRYLPEAFERMNYVLRDFRTREVFPMDPRVIDIISIIQSKIGTGRPLEILSGYRSPKTNAMLRSASTGVAKNSFHMYGQALDIRMPGYNTRSLRNTARSLRAGGVGYYPKSNFVHVDTGTIRSW
ncbi:MAG: DUF882 domain-containing protein [Alphaproteobacteria bacterium]|nr:DUF882 domain-containing protein [Alphaproteobacteria bacterium]